MRKLLVAALALFALVCLAAGTAYAGDCGCKDTCVKCKQDTCTTCKPKCEKNCGKCDTCKPKCKSDCGGCDKCAKDKCVKCKQDTCTTCKPKCESKCGKCDTCKPKCKPDCKKDCCKKDKCVKCKQDTCTTCKPKCESKCGKCDTCKPKCKSDCGGCNKCGGHPYEQCFTGTGMMCDTGCCGNFLVCKRKCVDCETICKKVETKDPCTGCVSVDYVYETVCHEVQRPRVIPWWFNEAGTGNIYPEDDMTEEGEA